jgi:hypothetical protein
MKNSGQWSVVSGQWQVVGLDISSENQPLRTENRVERHMSPIEN